MQTSPTEPRTIGDHIKARRLALHLLQSDIAKLLQVDEGSIQNWERNVYRPNAQLLPRVHAFLGYVP